MTTKTDNRRPYAPVSNVLAIIERARTRNLPDVIDPAFMNVAGVEGQGISRTKDALSFLGLVDEQGTPTQSFVELSDAPETEVPDRLSEIIRAAYSEEFLLIDPAIDDQDKIRGVFQKYVPKSTTAKMATLFLGLCKASGMEIKDPPPSRSVSSSAPKMEASTAQRRPNRRTKAPADPVDSNSPSVVVHGISNDDIAFLTKDEFDRHWASLGSLMWRRAHQDKPDPESRPKQLPFRVGEDS